jgi:hypothetical protein
MDERHENEQYFFDAATLSHLTAFVSAFSRPCCLCAPLLGQRLSQLQPRVSVRILDIDERFAECSGFRRFNLQRPEWLGEEYDLIICDPPFFNISLSRLFLALRTLSRNRYDQPLLITYPTRRAPNLLGTFHRFALRPTGYAPSYLTVQAHARNTIEFYGNLDEVQHERLRTKARGSGTA